MAPAVCPDLLIELQEDLLAARVELLHDEVLLTLECITHRAVGRTLPAVQAITLHITHISSAHTSQQYCLVVYMPTASLLSSCVKHSLRMQC
jgi:hypothetical protein